MPCVWLDWGNPSDGDDRMIDSWIHVQIARELFAVEPKPRLQPPWDTFLGGASEITSRVIHGRVELKKKASKSPARLPPGRVSGHAQPRPRPPLSRCRPLGASPDVVEEFL